MLLLIDAGNTRIKWALANLDHATTPADAATPWLAAGAVTHAELALLPAAWSTALAGCHIGRALVCNVAGAALGQQLQQLLQQLLPALPPGALAWFASTPQCAGVVNGYRNPAQLGSDRFAAAIGAHALAPGRATIVANCGTATTIDAISADGRFVGGMILPGLRMMAAALARDTAQLPLVAAGQVQAAQPGAPFADNTDDAILSGCLAAQAGAIERACAAHGAVECIVSGGAAAAVAAALGVPHRVVENIVLIGLHAAARSVDEESAC